MDKPTRLTELSEKDEKTLEILSSKIFKLMQEKPGLNIEIFLNAVVDLLGLTIVAYIEPQDFDVTIFKITETIKKNYTRLSK